MIAYFVHDSKKEKDLIVLPDRSCSNDAMRMMRFMR